MTDVFTKEKRSEIMSRIRSKDTESERVVFKYLRKEKIYFKKHYSKAPGKPDIALPRKKIAVFIDGNFWHGENYKATKNRLPEIYWREKIEKNIKKDSKVNKSLGDMGWSVLRIWEKEIKTKKTRQEALETIKNFLINNSSL
jgi:DNA mismatch endonuclease (patch repair protein)